MATYIFAVGMGGFGCGTQIDDPALIPVCFCKIVDMICKSEYNGVIIKIMYKYSTAFTGGKPYEMSVLRPRKYQSH